MRKLEELQENKGLKIYEKLSADYLPPDAEMFSGSIELPHFHASVVFGYNESGLMEHVSVSPWNRNRVPSWVDMCTIKDIFFYPNEMVVQIHPSESRYVHGVNGLNNVLHLWRPKDGDFSILNHPERWG